MSTSKIWYLIEIRFEDGDWFAGNGDRYWKVEDATAMTKRFDSSYETRVVRVVETREVVG